jgi:hypothetical protein
MLIKLNNELTVYDNFREGSFLPRTLFKGLPRHSGLRARRRCVWTRDLNTLQGHGLPYRARNRRSPFGRLGTTN